MGSKLELKWILFKSFKAKLSHLLSYKCWHCTATSKGDVILAILGWTVHLPRTRGFWEVHKLWGGLIKISLSSKDGESPSSIILFHSSSPVPPMAIVDLIGDVEVELLASAPYVSRLIFWTIITNNILPDIPLIAMTSNLDLSWEMLENTKIFLRNN